MMISFMQYLIVPIKWLSETFQENNGKASGSRFTAWFLTMLSGYYAYSDKIKNEHSLYAFVAMLLCILLIWGVIKWKDIEKISQNNKNQS